MNMIQPKLAKLSYNHYQHQNFFNVHKNYNSAEHFLYTYFKALKTYLHSQTCTKLNIKYNVPHTYVCTPVQMSIHILSNELSVQ